MITKVVLAPDADVVGSWQASPPLPVDAVGFMPAEVVGSDVAAYTAGDADTGPDQKEMVLPDIGESGLADIVLPLSPVNVEAGTGASSFDIDYPDGILAGDLIEIVFAYWSDQNSNAPTATGYTQRWSHAGPATYDLKFTKLYKIAAGTESGTLTISRAGAATHAAYSMVVWRYVDQTTPYDVAEEWTSGNADVDPDGVTTVTDGAVVQVLAAGRKWGGVSGADSPDNYQTIVNQCPNDRIGILVGWRTIGTAGAENPGALDYAATKTTVVTDVLRPASSANGRVLMVVASSSDETASAALAGSNCQLAGRDEVQTITSSLGSGTFTLTYDGATTAAIDFDATAAEIETALDGLFNLDALDIEVTGGPINTDEVSIEFVNALAGQLVPIITTNSGSVTVERSIAGAVATSFVYQGDVNVPRAGGSMEPQGYVWTLQPSSYDAGRKVLFSVGDHANLKTWAAALLVVADGDGADLVEGFGTEVTGNDAVADLGAITPTSRGARVLGVIMKTQVAGNYGVRKNASAPARSKTVASAVGDSTSLDLVLTPAVPAAAVDLGQSVWSGNEAFALGVMSLAPSVEPTDAIGLAEVLAPEDSESWIDIGGAAGDLFEVIEIDTDGLPGDAVIVGASVRFLHEADANHRVQMSACAINDAGDVILAERASTGYSPEPLATPVEVTTDRADQLGDGSEWNEYDRFGIAIRSSASAAGLGYHRVYWVELILDVLTGGPVVQNVGGPSIEGDPVSWDYLSAGGYRQTHYQVMVIAGAGQDPDTATVANPWSATAGVVVYDSGMVAGADVRSLEINDPLARGDCTYAVRSWARMAGRLVASDWASVDINIPGSPPTSPTVETAAAYDATKGVVRIEIGVPADATRGFLHRSIDGGNVFELVGEPVEIGASSTGFVVDPNPSYGVEILYRIGVDSGPMSESTWAHENPLVTPREYTPPGWFLQSLIDFEANTEIRLRKFERNRPKRSQVSTGPGTRVALHSPELPSEFEIEVMARFASEREALDVLLAAGGRMRLVSILGHVWTVEQAGDVQELMQRWQPDSSESTEFRDAHYMPMTLVEVSGAGEYEEDDGAYPSLALYPSA